MTEFTAERVAIVRLSGFLTAQGLADHRRHGDILPVQTRACVIDMRAATMAPGAIVGALMHLDWGGAPCALLARPAQKPAVMLDCYELAIYGQLAMTFTSEQDAMEWAKARARRWQLLQPPGSRASQAQRPARA